MNPPIPAIELENRLKTLWGATHMPFGGQVRLPYRTPQLQQTQQQLQQMLGVSASGLLHGPHGVGKTLLIHQLCEALPEKRFAITALSHTSLSGSDLLRAICHGLKIVPRFRRSDNVNLILCHWREIAPTQPLLIVDEAQNLAAQSLEELRLLSAAPQLRGQAPFSLLLVGDEDLLPRLQMGINRALRSRLGFCLELPALNPEQTRDYLTCRWKEVGVQHDPCPANAQNLLHQASAGIPRTINQLMQLTIAQAAQLNQPNLPPELIQQAIASLPWIGQNPPPNS